MDIFCYNSIQKYLLIEWFKIYYFIMYLKKNRKRESEREGEREREFYSYKLNELGKLPDRSFIHDTSRYR